MDLEILTEKLGEFENNVVMVCVIWKRHLYRASLLLWFMCTLNRRSKTSNYSISCFSISRPQTVYILQVVHKTTSSQT